jgi:hypothetical protein
VQGSEVQGSFLVLGSITRCSTERYCGRLRPVCVLTHRPYSSHGTSQRNDASHRIMMALALTAVLSCSAERLTTPRGELGTTRHASAEPRLAHPSPVMLLVAVAPGISNGVVRGALNEATAIWRDAGVMIAWHLSDGSSTDGDPSAVRVLLDEARGSVFGQDLPLGWINFNASGRSEGIVHLSYRNVVQLLDATEAYRSRPISYKELLAARALGRALAHELGHHLTASKVHSPSGLMKARRLVDELFSPARTKFTLSSDERQLAAKTLTDPALDITVEPCERLTAPSVSFAPELVERSSSHAPCCASPVLHPVKNH